MTRMKADALALLIEDLRQDIDESSVGTTPDTRAQVEDPKMGLFLDLTKTDCEVLFHSANTVYSFFEAIGKPSDASIELHDMMICHDALEALERCFSSVDEV